MPLLLPILATLIWAGNTIVSKLSAGAIEPAAISFYRWLVALLVLTPLMLPRVWKLRAQVRPYWRKLLVLAALGMVLYQSLAYFAAHSVSAMTMGLVVAAIPPMTMVIGMVLLKTRPSPGMLIGAVVSFAGLTWLLSGGHPAQLLQQGLGRGEMMMMLAAFSYALYGVLVKRWALPIPNGESLYLQVLCGTVLLLPGFALAPSVALTAHNLPLVLYAGILASTLAPWFWMHGLLRLGTDKTAVLMNLTPVFTALLAVCLLDEPLRAYHWIGGGLTLLGVAVAQALRQKPAPALRTQECAG
ncbi:DMT family transporter [Lysobacter yananisis]|uniref:DMT family transporter n=1 Tax=Lysobacter yananisis TaxID=1003114 RepID=A0ABY9P7L1_9GAMM|nr:DMT family transporter [Lysobacter yananisis]WMT03053.1 DMT family transporter [Lysobacter yananisis]